MIYNVSVAVVDGNSTQQEQRSGVEGTAQLGTRQKE